MGLIIRKTEELINEVEKGTLICRPADWMDVFKFLLLNYGAHVVTLMGIPGDEALTTVFFSVLALFAPSVGLRAAVGYIGNIPYLRARKKDGLCNAIKEFRIAYYAGALCTLGIAKELPDGNLKLIGPQVMVNVLRRCPNQPGWLGLSTENCLIIDAAVYGNPDLSNYQCTPKEGHNPDNDAATINSETSDTFLAAPLRVLLLRLPNNGPAVTIQAEGVDKHHLPYDYNILKAIIAILQIAYTVYELWKAQGQQFKKYGAGSFVLTSIPYTFMSIINLAASMCSPKYPALFLVRYDPSCDYTSGDADMIKHLNTRMAGAVGQFRYADECLQTEVPPANTEEEDFNFSFRHMGRRISSSLLGEKSQDKISTNFWARLAAGILFAITPFVVIYALTRFDRKQSTNFQLISLLLWLAVGQLVGLFRISTTDVPKIWHFVKFYHKDRWRVLRYPKYQKWLLLIYMWVVLLGVALGASFVGYIVVIKMLREFGTCSIV